MSAARAPDPREVDGPPAVTGLPDVSGLAVAVLAGGVSLERDVSLRSGRRMTDALVERGVAATLVDVDATLLTRLDEGHYDVAVVALHGASGEDGTVAALLELAGLPFTGAGSLASALAWDKPIARGLYARAGLAVADGVTLSQRAFRELGASAVVDRVAATLGLPLVVKPANGGSSLGVTNVEDAAALPAAIVTALSYADAALVERRVVGTEVAVAVLDGRALPAVEIVPRGGTYDYAARYTVGATDFHVPARLADEVLGACADAATRAVRAIGARHLVRVDLIVDADGVPVVIEIDTSPGMTETSLAPMAAAAAGIPFDELCRTLVALARRDG